MNELQVDDIYCSNLHDFSSRTVYKMVNLSTDPSYLLNSLFQIGRPVALVPPRGLAGAQVSDAGLRWLRACHRQLLVPPESVRVSAGHQAQEQAPRRIGGGTVEVI